MRIQAYLFFDGDCEAALGFYQRCLGGRVTELHRYAESPDAAQSPASGHQRVMHAALEVDGQCFMACDHLPGEPFAGHSGFAVSLNFPHQAERGATVFNALAEEGTVTVPFAPTFWGAHFGMLVDRFGVRWMVNCETTPSN